jgi:hypothetical protein
MANTHCVFNFSYIHNYGQLCITYTTECNQLSMSFPQGLPTDRHTEQFYAGKTLYMYVGHVAKVVYTKFAICMIKVNGEISLKNHGLLSRLVWTSALLVRVWV